jgi:hypothetical protein
VKFKVPNHTFALKRTYGRFVEPPRTYLAGVGETNMSQQLGG